MLVGVEGRTLQGARFGVGRYLTNLLRELVKLEGFEYLVYLSEPVDPLDFSSPNLSFKVISRAPSILWRHARLPLAMKRDRVDVHFSPSYFLPAIKVCPSVVVVHDLTIKVHPEWFKGDLRFRFDDLFWGKVKKAEAVITVSEHSKKDIVEYLGLEAERVTVIPEAADAIFRPLGDLARLREVREKYGLEENFIFTAGAVHTRRNYPRLMQAVARAERLLGSGLQLLILGPQAPFSLPIDIQAEAARCGLGGRVVQVEFVSEEDLLSLYNACALFVYPSLYEGFGLPVIEAMACAKPVACSDATSLPEVAGDAAVYFDPTDVEGMAEAIASIMGDEGKRKELAAASLERARSFSWRKAAEMTAEILRRAAGSR
jgi:glycosyltransferase involved in cell wall biosynthesis